MTPEKPDMQQYDPLVVRQHAQGIADWRYEKIYKGYVSPDVMTGLGRRAVAGALDVVDYRMKGFANQAERAETAMQPVIEQVRAKIDGLEEARRDGFAGVQELFQLEPMSPWLAQALDLEAHDNNVTAALTARKPDGSPAVSDETLLNFLEWHNHALANEQSRLEQNAYKMRIAFRERFEEAVSAGWMPQSARENLANLETVKLLVDDGMDTIMKGYQASTDDTEGTDHSVIRFSPMSIDNPGVQTHEFLHVMSGGDRDKTTHDRFGLTRLFGEGPGGVAMDEAITEHMANAMVSGSIDKIEPMHKHDVYINERGLLSTLATMGAKPVPIQLFVNAYFENGGNEAESRLWIALHKAFPFTDVIEDIGALEGGHENTDQSPIFKYERQLEAKIKAHKRSGGSYERFSRFLKS